MHKDKRKKLSGCVHLQRGRIVGLPFDFFKKSNNTLSLSMNRQSFLLSATGIAGILPLLGNGDASGSSGIIPPYLNKGDIIGITAPAGWISPEDIQPAVILIESLGYKIKLGKTIGTRLYSMSGIDEERRKDFQDLLDDDEVKAILCARGGYGLVRIIDELDFKRFQKKPKWLIGFSDITILHSHINHRYGIATIHSKMCNSFPDEWSKADEIQKKTTMSIFDALSGIKMQYDFAANQSNKQGIAKGMLVGGNLKTLESIASSESALKTRNKILFLEDTGEYMYSIDRSLWSLKRSGMLEHLSGLIIGGFKVKPDDDPDAIFGKTLEEIVLEKTEGCDYPVCFDFPVGHQKNNFALKCGVEHVLTVQSNNCNLKEI
jgi:muramoyltetrapeptide carboxypeptidase